jgi:hypothetical protein
MPSFDIFFVWLRSGRLPRGIRFRWALNKRHNLLFKSSASGFFFSMIEKKNPLALLLKNAIL